MLWYEDRPPRAPFDALVVVSDGRRRIRARASDISTRGMLLSTPLSLPVGDTVLLRFSVEGYQAEVEAEVVRAGEQARYLCGVKFRGAPPALVAAIRALVARSPRREWPVGEGPNLVLLFRRALRELEEQERGSHRRAS